MAGRCARHVPRGETEREYAVAGEGSTAAEGLITHAAFLYRKSLICNRRIGMTTRIVVGRVGRAMVVKRLVTALAAVSAWLLLPALVTGQPPLADRVIQPLGLDDASLFVHPEISQSHFRFIVIMLARSARVSIGFEEVIHEHDSETDGGNLAKVPIEKRTPLVGLTVTQALDALVSADARYSWREQDGMFLVRPVEAWNQATNFLNEGVAPLDEREQRPIEIVRRLYERRGLSLLSSSGGTIGNPTERTRDLNQPISVTLPGPTMLDELNAITKSHSQLSWMVTSVGAPEGIRNSCIYLIAFDGRFKGIGTDCGGGF